MARKRSDYRPRIADAELAELLAASGAVLVEGPRAVGKTATAMQASASHVLLDVEFDAQRMMILRLVTCDIERALNRSSRSCPDRAAAGRQDDAGAGDRPVSWRAPVHTNSTIWCRYSGA